MKMLARSMMLGSLALSMATSARLAAADAPACSEAGEGSASESDAKPRAEGMSGIVAEVLGELDLDATQRAAIESLRNVVGEHDARRSARLAMIGALGDALAAGKVDRAALEPVAKAFVQAASCDGATRTRGLEELHRILRPEQRVAFAEKLGARIEELGQRHEKGEWLDRLSKEIGLSEDQKSAIKGVMDSFAPAKEKHRAAFRNLLKAFSGDDFSVKKVLPDFDPASHAAGAANAMVQVTEKMVQVLTPEQRALVAKQIREFVAEKSKAGEKEPESEQKAPTGEQTGTSKQDLWGARGYGRWGGRGYGGYGRGYRRGYGRGYYGGGYGPGYYGGAYVAPVLGDIYGYGTAYSVPYYGGYSIIW